MNPSNACIVRAWDSRKINLNLNLNTKNMLAFSRKPNKPRTLTYPVSKPFLRKLRQSKDFKDYYPEMS